MTTKFIIIKQTNFVGNNWESEEMQDFDTLADAKRGLELLAHVFASEIKLYSNEENCPCPTLASGSTWDAYCSDGLSTYRICEKTEFTETEIANMDEDTLALYEMGLL